MKITFVSVPKPFDARFGRIQRNAIESWKRLPLEKEIILIGGEDGVGLTCATLGLTHVPDVAVSRQGAPLLASVLERARAAASSDAICYINADIILLSDFCDAARKTISAFADFLMIGQRRNLDLGAALDFSDSRWEGALKTLAEGKGTLFTPYGIDYFLFNRGLFSETIPDFRLGRFVWDNWLVNRALVSRAAVVDATGMVTAIHQNHDYSHLKGGEFAVRHGEDTLHNRSLIAGHPYIGHASVKSANFRLTREGMRKVQPIVSVVIPFHEDNQFTRERINSALCQTYTPAEEIILVDQSGTDAGRRIAGYFQTAFLRCRATEKSGVELMREIADEARGRLILMLDEEYALMPSSVKRGLQIFAARPDLDAVYGDEIVERRGNFLVRKRYKDLAGGEARVGRDTGRSGGMPPSGFMFKKDFFRRCMCSANPVPCACAHTAIPSVERVTAAPAEKMTGARSPGRKILFITDEMLPQQEWLAMYGAALAQGVVRNGAEAHVLIPTAGAGTTDVIERSVFAYKNPLPGIRVWHLCLAAKGAVDLSFQGDARECGVFCDFLRREHFDGVHFIGIPRIFPLTLAGRIREYVAQTFALIVDRGGLPAEPDACGRLRDVLNSFTRVGCAADASARELVAAGVAGEKIRRVPVSIIPCKLRKVKSRDAEKRFVYAGEISPAAHVKDLIAGFGKLKSRHMRLHLHGPADAGYCAGIILDVLSKEPRIEYAGHSLQAERVLSGADVLVVTRPEGLFPLVMTALGAGIPVVAPDIEWLKEAAGRAGHCIIFDPAVKNSLTRALRRAVKVKARMPKSTIAADVAEWMRMYAGRQSQPEPAGITVQSW